MILFSCCYKEKSILYQLLRPKQNWKQFIQAFFNLNHTIKKTLVGYVFHKDWYKQVVEVRYKVVICNYFSREFPMILRIMYWKCTPPPPVQAFLLQYFLLIFMTCVCWHCSQYSQYTHTHAHGITRSLLRLLWNYWNSIIFSLVYQLLKYAFIIKDF